MRLLRACRRRTADSSARGERIAALSPLEGLLAFARRRQPLVRDCCTDLLAMASSSRRGVTPGSAGDDGLVADLVESAGVFEMWPRHGVTTLFSAAGFLAPATAASHPRLELLRSIVLRLSLQVDEAAAGPRGLEPRHGAFADQLPLELGQRREDATRGARPRSWCRSAPRRRRAPAGPPRGPTGPARC